jgi:uncharacterized membrane protein
MKAKEFINLLDERRIADAIAAAELKSSGEIRVFVSHREVSTPLPEAAQQFTQLGMDRTRHRNGVLIFVAPASQKFAVVGDSGVHQKCGDEFWQKVGSVMTDLMKQGKYTDAILEAVRTIGDLLAVHFPRDPDDRNELPDTPVRG